MAVSETFPPLSDFNDLAAAEGLDVVRQQVQGAMDEAAGADAAQDASDQAPPVVDWPLPLTSASAAPELSAELLPGWLGRYVGALAASTQTPGTLSVLFALSVVAACVQRRYVVQVHEGYSESASFWSLSVAASGSRKSAIVSALTKPLTDWERRANERMRREINATLSRILAAEAAIKHLQGKAGKATEVAERERLRKAIEEEQNNMPERQFPPLVFSGDATVESLQAMLAEQGGRAAVLSAEGGLFSTLAGTYGGGAGPSLDVLLEGFSGGEVRVNRASRKAHISRAAVTVGLMLQPDLANDAAGSSRFRASGLMARFAYAVPQPFVGGRNVRSFSAVPDDLRSEYARAVDELLGEPNEGPFKPPITVALEPHALETWFDFAQWVEDALAEGGELSAMPDWGAKLAGLAARIALLFELVTSGPQVQEVANNNMVRAIELCHALVPHARAAFLLLGADEVDRDADHLLQWVMRRGPCEEFKQSEAHAALHNRFTKKERLAAALQRLQASGCLRHARRRNEGARASDVWLVNPRLFLG